MMPLQHFDGKTFSNPLIIVTGKLMSGLLSVLIWQNTRFPVLPLQRSKSVVLPGLHRTFWGQLRAAISLKGFLGVSREFTQQCEVSSFLKIMLRPQQGPLLIWGLSCLQACEPCSGSHHCWGCCCFGSSCWERLVSPSLRAIVGSPGQTVTRRPQTHICQDLWLPECTQQTKAMLLSLSPHVAGTAHSFLVTIIHLKETPWKSVEENVRNVFCHLSQTWVDTECASVYAGLF